MQLLFAGYQLGETNAVQIGWGRELLRNDAGIGYGFQYTANCPRIILNVNGQADATSKGLAVEAVLALPAQDLKFLNDDGTPSFKSVTSLNTRGGVRCISGPNWSDRAGAQHATWLEYGAVFQWETSFGATGPLLMSYSETVKVEGGTPRKVVHEVINFGFNNVEQITIPRQKYRVTQSGFAVGIDGFPFPPAAGVPLYPDPIGNPVGATTPDRVGNGYKGYRVDWSYFWEFASAPAYAYPQFWTG